jgi:hypothetical protein
MTLSQTPGSLERLYNTPWRFQQTFHTPLNNLRVFVSTISCAQAPFEAASLTIADMVFEPKHFISLLNRYSLSLKFGRDCCVWATGPQEAAELLEAGLSDWLDFAFEPKPKAFVIYADHDEYTTFYTNTKSNLDRVVQELLAAGFEKVQGYERTL